MKLNDISKNYISTLDTETVYSEVLEWAKNNNQAFYEKISQNPDYAKAILGIERGGAKPRKELVKWDEVPAYAEYFYEDMWDRKRDFPENLSKEDVKEILVQYKNVYKADESAEDWFPNVRNMSEELGYAGAPKLYKQNPEAYKGHVGDVSTVIRVAVTGRRNTPDLYQIMQVLGYDKVMERIDEAIEILG